MDQELQDDWLDLKLREEAPYIDDAGFTAKVVQQLPAPRRSRSSRHVILLGFAVIGALVAYLLSGGGQFVIEEARFLIAMPLGSILAVAGICALIVTAVGMSAALSKARQLRS